MKFQEWSEVVQPRVDGTWNVHQSLIDSGAQLDFFVVFGSGGGHTGYYGQANYTSANTFLDAFIEYRHGLGLPASIIDLGVVGDVGYLLEQEHLFEGFKNGGFYFLTEQQVLNAAAISVANSRSGPLSSFCLGGLSEKPMNDPTNRVNWKRDVRFAVSHHFHRAKESSDASDQTGKDGNEAERFLTLARTDPEQLRDAVTISSLAKFIATALGSLMLRPVEDFSLTDSLTAIGLDSIISIELVDWVQQQFHIGLSSMEITSCTSLLHLADKIVGEIIKA